MTARILSTLILILLCQVLPLAGNFALLQDYRVWILACATAALNLAQPAEAGGQQEASQPSSRLVVAMSVISAVVPLVLWAYFPTPSANAHAWAAAGSLVIMAGLAIRIYAIRHLGRHFTTAVQAIKNHELVQTGPYKFIRHPTYLGALLVLCGYSIVLHTIPGLAIALVAMLIAFRKRIAEEEALLSQLFGDAFKQYQRRTYRLVPFIW